MGATLALFTLTGHVRSAGAHGGLPRANAIAIEPGNPSHIVLRSDYWGLFRTTDGGTTWQYGCSELYGGVSTEPVERTLVLMPGGRALVDAYDGIRITDDFCTFRPSPDLVGRRVADLTASGSDLHAVATAPVDGGFASTLLFSSDKGETWTAKGTSLPRDFLATSLRVAPSDAKRLYVGGAGLDGSRALVARSDDGGDTWSLREVASLPGESPVARVLAIHPSRPDVSYVRVDHQPIPPSITAPHDLWASSDGAGTWTLVHTSRGDNLGLALSPDGAALIVAGPADGLLAGAVDDVIGRRQSALRTLLDEPVWGVAWADGAVFAGTNAFGGEGTPPVLLGRIDAFDPGADGYLGFALSPRMNLCQLTLPTCLRAACAEPWAGSGGFEPDFLESPSCKRGTDASIAPSSPTPVAESPSTACNIATASVRASSWAQSLRVLLGVVICSTWFRRARRISRRPSRM